MSRDPFKIIVWGPGIVGNGVIKEIIKRPELELVAVLCYSPEKNGRDVGEVLGLPPVGIKMTTDKESIFNMEADVVMHSPQVTSGVGIDGEITNEVCRLLESGRNVISSVAYFFLKFHSDEFEQKMQDACKKGDSSLLSTGINPGLLTERFMTTFTAVCTEIYSISLKEIGDIRCIDSKDMLSAVGVGLTPEQAARIDEELWFRYYGETITHCLAILGFTPDRIECERVNYVAEKDYELAAMTVGKGTIGCSILKYTAIVDGKPFLTQEEGWYIDSDLCPIPVTSEDYYEIKIDGAPTSIDVRFDLVAQLDGKKRFRDGDETMPAYLATVAPMIQAIPVVIKSAPGIVYPATFTNYVKDLRDFDVQMVR